ncbi:IS21-like element helper ATPase IstB [Streptomyces sp. CAU 1734]|uniref:IS21-like element helper ATPase IstB n=1 Tax=Streptomyces sp. CAU 1734 TaxID=3140360 RepID=UPI0032610121
MLHHATPPVSPKPDVRSIAASSLGYALFATRWLQAPLYFGLVAAQGVYVYKFFNELWSLILHVVTGQANETYVMLAVLKLVDVVMIANLLIMVIVGGYETFVSRIGLQGHRDQPEWLSHVNSNVLKVKLATAIVGISSVHLLQMFVDVGHTSRHSLLWGTVIHMAFIASAAILAYMSGPMESNGHGAAETPRKDHHTATPAEFATSPGHAERAGEPSGHESAGSRESAEAADGAGRPVNIPAPATDRYTTTSAGRAATGAPGVEARVRAAGFPARKTLEEFDREHQRSLDWEIVSRLGKTDFIAEHENAVFLGPPGTGKTHLAIALGIRACQAGHRVQFATAAEWASRLGRAEAAGRLADELSGLDRHELLIIDEIGYLPFGGETAGLFFRLISHRYERGSLIVTGDQPFGRWSEVFGDTPLTRAMTDRLAHHAEVITLTGASYRRHGRKLESLQLSAGDDH